MNHLDSLGASGSTEKGSDVQHAKKVKELEARAKRFRVSLRESEERFKVLCNLIPEAICTFDLEGTISYWNKAAQDVFGWTSEEVLGKPVLDFLFRDIPDDSPIYIIITNPDTRIHLSEAPEQQTFRNKEDDPFEAFLSISEVRSDSNLSYVVSIQPLPMNTYPIEIESPLSSHLNPQHSNQTLCDFWLNVSHEIRKPLSGITGMLQLAMKTDLSKEQREYLEMLQITSDKMMTLLNDVIDFSKIETGQFDLELIDFDLHSTLESTIGAFAPHASEKGLLLDCIINPNVPNALLGDPGRFRKIILNLLDNAVKYTPTGSIHVRCDLESEIDDRVQLHLQIEDSGIGIDAEQLGTLFDLRTPWRKNSPETTPSRLGLSICKELAELMDGRIWAESIEGSGSTFHFTCQFVRRLMPKLMPRERVHASLSNLRVLYVDSNTTDRIIMDEILSSRVSRYEDAADWESALLEITKARTSNQPYHLIIVDSLIPPSHVFDFASRMKEDGFLSNTRVIVLTSMGQRGDAARCRELGISAYLLKPVKQSELIEAIQKVISSEESTFTDESQLITRHTIREDRERIKFNFLLVEDNPLNQEIAVRTIAKHGHGIEVADQVKKVMDFLSTNTFDVVLLNTQLATMDAFELTRKIRKKERQTNQHVPMIAIMDPGSHAEQSFCLDSGMDNYIQKPLKYTDIHNTVHQTIDLLQHRTKRNPKVISQDRSDSPFNFSKILKMFYGDQDLLRQVFKLFNEHYPSQIEALQKAASDNNPTRLAKASGRLKSSAQNFGETLILKQIEIIEKLGQEQAMSDATQAIQGLDTLIGQFCTFVNRNLKKGN